MYPYYYPSPGQLIRGSANNQEERFFPFILPFAAGLLAGPLLVSAFAPAFAPPYPPPYPPYPPGMPYPPPGYPGQGPAYNIYPNQGGTMPAFPMGANQQQGITENIYIYK